MDIAPDILAQLKVDFPTDAVPELVATLLATNQNARIQRCIVFKARGHRWFFNYLCRMTKLDFRDMILAAEYGNGDGQLRLYDFNKPIPEAKIEDPFASHDFSKSPDRERTGKAV